MSPSRLKKESYICPAVRSCDTMCSSGTGSGREPLAIHTIILVGVEPTDIPRIKLVGANLTNSDGKLSRSDTGNSREASRSPLLVLRYVRKGRCHWPVALSGDDPACDEVMLNTDGLSMLVVCCTSNKNRGET